jgi:hypothetical protein
LVIVHGDYYGRERFVTTNLGGGIEVLGLKEASK